MGRSLYEIHTSYVEELKKRGEKIVHCLAAGPAMNSVLGYDKTIGYKTAGYIYRNEYGPEGEFELHQDHLIGIHQVKWADIGLCDARCWYGAVEDNKIKEANKEQADKSTENKLMSSDFMVVSQARDKMLDALKHIHKAVSQVNRFSSEAEQHKQMDKALRDISEILEGAGIT